jgi:serine/threonine-protein phosphatase CPPED1
MSAERLHYVLLARFMLQLLLYSQKGYRKQYKVPWLFLACPEDQASHCACIWSIIVMSSLSQEDLIKTVPRYEHAQVGRSLIHPALPQPTVTPQTVSVDASLFAKPTTDSHCFVVAADTQLGMIESNQKWDIEMEFSRKAVERINSLHPRPLFCCICGDLVDMTSNIFLGKPKSFGSSESAAAPSIWTEEECDQIQEQQNKDVKRIWSRLHPDIALVCLCGNHDVGNRPTPISIERYKSFFGDDYLAFWVNGTYNIVLNSALFSDPTDALNLYAEQWNWLEEQLQFATKYSARNIFVFSHHPWFLYSEDEDIDQLTGRSYLEPGLSDLFVSDSYFPIPKPTRQKVLELFRQYKVSASFAGHFHQNVVSKTSFGMEMVITGGLSMVLQSTGNPNARNEPETQGFRIVTVNHDTSGGRGMFQHHFLSISS